MLTKIARKVEATFPISWVIEKSKNIRLPGFEGIPLYDVVRFFFSQVRRVGLTERTSAISFNFIMAIPAMVMFFCTLIPYLPIAKELTRQIHGLIRDIIPGESNNKALITFIDDFLTHQRYGLLSIGLLVALFYSSNAMMGIMRAFDKNYVGFKKRRGWETRLTAIRLTIILFVLMFISLLFLVMQGAVLKWVGINKAWMRTIITNGRWVVIVLLFLSSISFIYRHAPFIHKKWRLINPGSILATTMMVIFFILFSYWVNNFANYHKIYGSIGTILILMLLVYFNSRVLLIGFELNVSINSLKHEADERKKLQTSGE